MQSYFKPFQILAIILLFSGAAFSAGKLRAVKEAENLTLLQDRFLACNTLYKAYKKAKPAEKPILRERLFYFSKNFYTDKGFQYFLGGKELFEKGKYQEALDKLGEADELEKANTDILFYMSLSQIWLKKYKDAEGAIQKVIQLNPLDGEILKNQLSLEVVRESWDEALQTAATLQKEFGDKSILTRFFYTLAQAQLAKKEERIKIFEAFLQKNKKYPEVYFYLSELNNGEKRANLIKKYNELCKKNPKDMRDVGLCSRIQPPA